MPCSGDDNFYDELGVFCCCCWLSSVFYFRDKNHLNEKTKQNIHDETNEIIKNKPNEP